MSEASQTVGVVTRGIAQVDLIPTMADFDIVSIFAVLPDTAGVNFCNR